MNFKKLIITGSIVSVLAGATAPAYADPIGALLGAAGGAVVGSNIGKGKGNIAAIAVGTLVGAGIGDSLTDGRRHTTTVVKYEDHDRGWRGHHNGWRHRHHNNYRPYYRETYTNYWVSQPAYVNEVVSVNDYEPSYQQTNSGYCREFSQDVSIGGRMQESYGTACRQPDGSWEIQK